MSTSTVERRTPEPKAEARVDKAQYGLAAVLAVVGVVVVVDATRLEPGFADQVVGPSAFPYVIGTVLVVLAALLAVATARGDSPHAEEGEDVDLTQRADWLTVLKLVGVFVLNIAFIDWLGWAITGALLFAGCAWVLGSRTQVRDLLVGVVLSVGSWYGFYVGLGIPIPAGVLDGVL